MHQQATSFHVAPEQMEPEREEYMQQQLQQNAEQAHVCQREEATHPVG